MDILDLYSRLKNSYKEYISSFVPGNYEKGLSD